jgi:hypothetical protein
MSWREAHRPIFASGARVQATALAALLAVILGIVVAPAPLSAQDVESVLHFPRRPPPPPRKPPPPSNTPMLVQATEIRYDYTNNSGRTTILPSPRC